jgi:hypothetical protein
MKKYIAVITDKEVTLKAKIAIYSDDSSSLEDVTSAYEKQTGYQVGKVNRFNSMLKEIIEVDFSDPIVICDDFENY